MRKIKYLHLPIFIALMFCAACARAVETVETSAYALQTEEIIETETPRPNTPAKTAAPLITPSALETETPERRTIAIANAFLNAEFYTSFDSEPTMGNADEHLRWAALKNAERTYGVWVESDYAGDFSDFSAFDACHIEGETAARLAYNGELARLDGLFDENVFEPVFWPNLEGAYAFRLKGGATTPLLGYIKNYIEDYELEDPRTLYEDGRWDFDAWRDMLRVLTDDWDGDGVADIYGFGAADAALVDAALIADGSALIDERDADRFGAGAAVFFVADERFLKRAANYGFDYGFVPFPKIPEYYNDALMREILYCVPKNAENIELILTILSEIIPPLPKTAP